VSIAAIITDLIAAGTPAELVGRVAEALAARDVVTVQVRDEAAERRRAADRERKANVRGNPQTSAEPVSLPSLAKEIPPKPPKENSTLTHPSSLLDSAGDAFELFRRAYPRRSGPWKPAKQKFLGLVRSGEDAEEIIRGAEEFARLKAEADPQFIPMPATWLNQERWKDPPDASRGPTNVRQFAKFDDGKAKFRDALARFRGEATGPSAADEGAITAEFKVVSSD
jgi:hypothetical protein